MKIVHVVESFAGGVLDFLADLTWGMPEHRHIIIHGIRADTPATFRGLFPSNVTFAAWTQAKREIALIADMLAFAEVIRLLKKVGGCDIVHLHSSKAGVHGRIACKLLGMGEKAIYSPHGISFLRKDISPTRARFFVILEKAAAGFGGRIIACSASEAEELRRHGIHCTHISNGARCRGDIQHGAVSDSLVIGTLGRITHQKNPALFDTIASSFADDHFKRFLWIGDGELRNQLKSPNIEVSGWRPRDEAAAMLSGIDVYLSTSLWEGMPLSVLAAMCGAKPLILHDCTGNRDLVREGENGFLFRDPKEAVHFIRRFSEDRESISAMGRYSREVALSEFSLDRTLKAYKELYAAMCIRE